MRLSAITLAALSAAMLAGCSSPPAATSLNQPRAKRVVVAPQTVKLPAGSLAPIDRWKTDLELVLPAPWRLDEIEAQIVAPRGYTRISGDRGLALWVTDGRSRQVFWILPSDFEGRIVEPEVAARQVGKDDAFTLWEPRKSAEGWSATAQIAVGLGFQEGIDGRRSKLARTTAEATIGTISQGLERFKADHGVYPVRLRDLWRKPAKAGDRWKGPYIDPSTAHDPWGGDYHYTSTPFSFELASFGADGAPGGEADDADVVFK